MLEDSEYELVGTFDKKQSIESTAVVGFIIPVKAIFNETIFLQTLTSLLS